jgi:hypothetical protein
MGDILLTVALLNALLYYCGGYRNVKSNAASHNGLTRSMEYGILEKLIVTKLLNTRWS